MSIPQVRYWRTESDGLWRFSLVSVNGEVQTPSGQGYKTRAGCLAGIAAAKRNWARAIVKQTDKAPTAA